MVTVVEGRCYKTRDGNVTGPAEVNAKSTGPTYPYPWRMSIKHEDGNVISITYSADGLQFIGSISSLDLIEEIIEQPKEEPPKKHIDQMSLIDYQRNFLIFDQKSRGY